MNHTATAYGFLRKFEAENFDQDAFLSNLTSILRVAYARGYHAAEDELEDQGRLDSGEMEKLKRLEKWQGRTVDQLRRFFDARAGRIQADPDRELEAVLELANAGAFMANQSAPVLA